MEMEQAKETGKVMAMEQVKEMGMGKVLELHRLPTKRSALTRSRSTLTVYAFLLLSNLFFNYLNGFILFCQ
jgi:hypothetical protein